MNIQENNADIAHAFWDIVEEQSGTLKQQREEEILEASEAVMGALGDYRSAIWCEVLARVVVSVFSTKLEIEQTRREDVGQAGQ